VKCLFFCLVATIAFLVALPAHADQKKATKTPPAGESEGFNIFKMFRKGGRGLTNIATSPCEIPNQMVREAKRHNSVGGQIAGYFSGIPIGCGWMIYRLGTGLFDFVTQPAPLPTYEKSYIEPEYLFTIDPYAEE